MAQSLGKRIMQHRKCLGLTQDQLAEMLGVTAQAVSKWENDQSCPDISMLPVLANIFGISTDALLGCEPESKVHEAEIVSEIPEDEHDGLHFQKGSWEFHYDSGKRDALGLAILVLGVGIQLLVGKALQWELSFWGTLWPTALTVFGVFGLFSRLSFFSIGCLLFGGYFMLDNLKLLPFSLGGELVFPAVLVLFGLSLLVDALKKPKKPMFQFHHNAKKKNDYHVDGETFEYSASFGEHGQDICISRLSQGRISTSFGEYRIDLSGVEEVNAGCQLQVNCSFGELTLQVPKRFTVKQSNSTAFGEISVSGHPDPQPQGVINLKANASFGEICIQYI